MNSINILPSFILRRIRLMQTENDGITYDENGQLVLYKSKLSEKSEIVENGNAFL